MLAPRKHKRLSFCLASSNECWVVPLKLFFSILILILVTSCTVLYLSSKRHREDFVRNFQSVSLGDTTSKVIEELGEPTAIVYTDFWADQLNKEHELERPVCVHSEFHYEFETFYLDHIFIIAFDRSGKAVFIHQLN